MKPSGKATSFAPRAPASAISAQALSTVAARSRKTGAAWTAATRKGTSASLIRSSRKRRDLRREQLEPSGVDHGFALREDRHAGIDARRPLPAERIGPVELRLEDDESLLRRSIDLDGLDLRRGRHDAQPVGCRRIDDLRDHAAGGRSLAVDG